MVVCRGVIGVHPRSTLPHTENRRASPFRTPIPDQPVTQAATTANTGRKGRIDVLFSSTLCLSGNNDGGGARGEGGARGRPAPPPISRIKGDRMGDNSACRPESRGNAWGSGGWGGIRTHEPLRVGGFQDRCLQPLGHPSPGRNPTLARHRPPAQEPGCPPVRRRVTRPYEHVRV